MNIAIFGNAMKQQTLNEVQHLIEYMAAHQIQIYLSQELRQELNLRDYKVYPREDETILSEIDPIDFALSVGGDGTFLTTAAAVGSKSVPILGINCGHLGFLAEVKTQDVDYIMDKLLAGDYTVEQRTLLAVTCSEGGHILDPNALNEVAIMKQGLSSMITVETRLNGEFLHAYEADGLIIGSPNYLGEMTAYECGRTADDPADTGFSALAYCFTQSECASVGGAGRLEDRPVDSQP